MATRGRKEKGIGDKKKATVRMVCLWCFNKGSSDRRGQGSHHYLDNGDYMLASAWLAKEYRRRALEIKRRQQPGWCACGASTKVLQTGGVRVITIIYIMVTTCWHQHGYKRNKGEGPGDKKKATVRMVCLCCFNKGFSDRRGQGSDHYLHNGDYMDAGISMATRGRKEKGTIDKKKAAGRMVCL